MEHIKLICGPKTYDFPVVRGHRNSAGINFCTLYEKTGLFSYDSGLRSTAVCQSAISYIDSVNGNLFYRGYNVEELINKYDYLDVARLLIYGKIPSPRSGNNFLPNINLDYSALNKLLSATKSNINNAAPIDLLKIFMSLAVAQNSDQDSNNTITNILSLMPMMISHIANRKRKHNLYTGESYIETFLRNYYNLPDVDPLTIDLIQKFLILHMEHEQNASTTAVRIIGATGNSPLNSVFSGILALEGTRHGGANEQVLKMLNKINSRKDMQTLIADAKNNKQRISGLGHRVYKTTDPRAKILKHLCLKHFSSHPLLQKAIELETLIGADEYFIKRKLYPNIDFYSGILLNGLKIEGNMFLLFFILARIVGWLSHWKEMAENGDSLIRPRQIYTGR